MADLNKAQVIGRLGQDPELRYTKSDKPVVNISVATSYSYKTKDGEKKENTEWHRVVFWGKLAEIVEKYLSKGSRIFVEGRLQTKQWEDQDGNKRYTTEIVGQEMIMLDSKGDSQNGGGGNFDSNTNLDENFDDLDDDLPF